VTGDPELKSRPASSPKYQMLFSPWEKEKRGKNRKAKIKNRVNVFFITRDYYYLTNLHNNHEF